MPLAAAIIAGLAPGAPAIRADGAAAPAFGGAAEAFDALLGEEMGGDARRTERAAQAIAANDGKESSGARAAAPAGPVPVAIEPYSGVVEPAPVANTTVKASPDVPVMSASSRPAQSDIATGEAAQVDPARAFWIRQPGAPLQRLGPGGETGRADMRAEGRAQAPVLVPQMDMTQGASRPAAADASSAAGDEADVQDLEPAQVDAIAASSAPSADAAPEADGVRAGEGAAVAGAETRTKMVRSPGIEAAPDAVTDAPAIGGADAVPRADTGAVPDIATATGADTAAGAAADADAQSLTAPVVDPKAATQSPPAVMAPAADKPSNAAPIRREADGRRGAAGAELGKAGDDAGKPADRQAKAQEPAAPQPASAPKAGAPEPTQPRSPDAFQALLQAQAKPSAEPGTPRSVEGALDPAGDSGMRSAPDRAAETPRPASLTQPGAAPRFAPHTVQTLAAQIMRRQAEGVRVFDIRMDPPELGRVGVRLELGKDHTVKAMLSAERPDTLHELQRTARDLERALAEAGLNLAENGLSFSLGGQRGDRDGRGFAEPHGARSLVEIDVPRAGSPVTALYGFALARAAGLDIQA